jgi:hypothetical protein
MIMAVGNPENGRGFGRVMPIFKRGERGGVRIVKLLSGQTFDGQGIETFPKTGQPYAPAFSGYLFVFQEGLDRAVEGGKALVDDSKETAGD